MLIIVSGVETIHKKFFAREIRSEFISAFPIADGFTMDFKVRPYQVYNSEGTVVFRPGSDTDIGVNTLLIDSDNDGIRDERGHAIAAEAERWYVATMNDGVRDSHYMNTFSDPWFDYGLYSEINAPMDGVIRDFKLVHPHTFDSVRFNYDNKPHSAHVITGSFSKHFINRCKEIYGDSNVVVVNITRNPSVAFLLNEKTAHYYTLRKPNDPRDRAMDRRKLEKSIINNVIVNDVPNVITIAYEDILRDGSFNINGTTVPAPPSMLSNNGYVTTWELTDHIPLGIVTPPEVDEFNTKFKNYVAGRMDYGDDGYNMIHTRLVDVIELFNKEQGCNTTARQISSRVPKDIFSKLGYTPLTYDEILAGK